MQVEGVQVQSIEWLEQEQCVCIIDQTLLPYEYQRLELRCLEGICEAISTMRVRGAPLIGVSAAYGLFFALRAHPDRLEEHAQRLIATRPTAVNLAWAVNKMVAQLKLLKPSLRAQQALLAARAIELDELAACAEIGRQGLQVIKEFLQGRPKAASEPINILTHCNAGALATVDHGTALAPIYAALAEGIDVHVWVDETRPRNQGASLTAWELGQAGVAHTIIADNTGGHLMQHGLVDLCLVGSDRTTAQGDVCNKIGTYLKALAANDNHIPFWVALPFSTIDWGLLDGCAEIPIEQRDDRELTHIKVKEGEFRLVPANSPVANYAFDVTPARLITGLLTEFGRVNADVDALQALYNRVKG